MEMEMIKTTYTVKPGVKTPRRSIPLTLLDRMFPFPGYSSVIYVYQPKKGSAIQFAAELRESLSKTLVHFYPIAGRYKLDSAGVREIDCNDTGVLYVEATTESDLNHFGDLAPSPKMSILLPTIDHSHSHDISSYPLLALQVTYFNCGSVSIGASVEHNCVDGSSLFHLIKSWSEIARGLAISLPPFLDRTSLLCPRDPPRPEFDHKEYSKLGSTNQIYHTNNNAVFKVSVFELKKDQINQMKTEVARHGNTYSTFEVLAGHIWKCVCKARGLGDEETILAFSLNARFDRWKPKLPLGFFGNAVLFTAVEARASDLDSKPLCYTSAKIHKASVKYESEYTRSALDHLALLPDLSAARLGPHIFKSPNFNITSWANMGINETNFGWGRPIYAGPGNPRNGKAFIYDGHQNQSLFVAISLQAHQMEMFEKLFYAFCIPKL